MTEQDNQAWVLDRLREARACLDRGDLQQAQSVCHRVIDALSRHPASVLTSLNGDALHIQGLAALAAGRFAEAEDLIRRSIGFKPLMPLFHENLARLLTTLGKPGADAAMARARQLSQPMAESLAFDAVVVPDQAAWAAYDGYETRPLPPALPLQLPGRMEQLPAAFIEVVEQLNQQHYAPAPVVARGEGARLLFFKWPAVFGASVGDELLLPFSRCGAISVDPCWLKYLPFVWPLPNDSGRFRIEPDRLRPTVVHMPGEYFFLGGRRNFGHWLGDFLPNLMSLDSLSDRPDIRIVTTRLTEWQKELLSSLQPSWPVVQLDSDLCTFYQFDTLWLPQPRPMPDRFAYLRRAFGVDEARGERSRRVFISRPRSAGADRLANYGEVMDWAKSQGFVICDMETMNLGQKIAALRDARIVMSVPGSACFNYFCFAPVDSVLISLWPKEIFEPCDPEFLSCTLSYNLPFFDQTVLVLGGSTMENRPTFTIDFPVAYPVPLLRRALEIAEAKAADACFAAPLIVRDALSA